MQAAPPPVRPVQNRVVEIRAVEVRPTQVRAAEIRLGQVRAAEVRPAQVRTTEIRPAQVGATEVGPQQVGPAEIGCTKVRRAQTSTRQACIAEIKSPVVVLPSPSVDGRCALLDDLYMFRIDHPSSVNGTPRIAS